MKIDDLFDPSGKTAIVTGGAGGIGKAAAGILAKASANIVIGGYYFKEAESGHWIRRCDSENVAYCRPL